MSERQRHAFRVQFVGAGFCGSQRQAKLPTVQGALEEAFSVVLRQPIKIVLASRVDTGVNARGMVGHADFCWDHHTAQALWELRRHINGVLPAAVALTALQPVEHSFHARRQAVARTYLYRLRPNSPKAWPLDHLTAHYPYPVQLDSLNVQATPLLGEWDCYGLTRGHNKGSSTICRITESRWYPGEAGILLYRICADHFLYRMVRNIVGTMIDMERGRLAADHLQKALHSRERSYLGHAAKACGLCLEEIHYSHTLFEDAG